MAQYRISGHEIYFFAEILELAPFEVTDTKGVSSSLPETNEGFISSEMTLSSQAVGWVGEKERQVEVWSAQNGILLKVSGGSDFMISQNGISRKSDHESDLQEATGLDRDILLGPALVLALALNGIWCLHASAVIYKNTLFVLLGESGQGKSTLAAYLSSNKNWRLVADDILPVTLNSTGAEVWPHFPQLKLSIDAQPGNNFPEHLPLDRICVLTDSNLNSIPNLNRIPAAKSSQMILRHTAGTRMFDPGMLARHLTFAAQAAGMFPVYELDYPRRMEILPAVKELLEGLC